MKRQQTLPLDRADEFEKCVRKRIPNENAVQFLLIMQSAANPSTATPDDCVGLRSGVQFILDCRQKRLTELLGVCERVVRATACELESLGIFVRHRPLVATPNGPRRELVYVLNTQLLFELPELSMTAAMRQTLTDLSAVDLWAEPSQELPENLVDAGGSAGPHGLGLVQDQELKPLESMAMDQGDLIFLGWGQDRLSDNQVRQIVGSRDRKAFDFLDREGLKTFPDQPAWKDTPLLKRQRAALWHHAATSPGIRKPVAVLKKHLKTGEFSKLTDADEDWAMRFLKDDQQSQSPIVVPSFAVADDRSPMADRYKHLVGGTNQ